MMLPEATGRVQYFHGVFTPGCVQYLVSCNFGLRVNFIVVFWYDCRCFWSFVHCSLLLGHLCVQPLSPRQISLRDNKVYVISIIIKNINFLISLPLISPAAVLLREFHHFF